MALSYRQRTLDLYVMEQAKLFETIHGRALTPAAFFNGSVCFRAIRPTPETPFLWIKHSGRTAEMFIAQLEQEIQESRSQRLGTQDMLQD